MKIAYQGVPGAFSEAAAAALFPAAELAPQRSFGDAFAALADRSVAGAVVPVENSHAGMVADVYDLLREDAGATIVAEAIVRVRYGLLGVPGATLEGIKIARSHPQALAQCDTFLRAHGIEPEVAYDTAGAAADVARAADPTIAALASGRAARRYGLTVLADGIETSASNATRFFALAPRGDDTLPAAIPAAMRAGKPKTSLAYVTANVPGALLRTLQPFATVGVQLTKIESRPSRVAAWDYVFYLDFEGDPAVSPAADALEMMRRSCAWVKVLGTYPAAAGALDPD
jgi:prephenate dehydratase